MKTRSVTMYCRGTPKLGYGHLHRTLVVARELRRKKFNVIINTNPDGLCKKYVIESGFVHSTAKALGGLKPDAIVVDCNELTIGNVENFRKLAPTINIALQGPSKWYSDLSIIPSTYLDSSRPDDAVSTSYMGAKFVPLRYEFRVKRSRTIIHKDQAFKILVSLGSSDYEERTRDIFGILNSVDKRLEITYILGPGSNGDQNLMSRFKYSPHSNRLVSHTDYVAAYMCSNDVVITSAGVTMYESMCLGIPTVALYSNKFHKGLCNHYEKRGTLLSGTNDTLKSITESLLDNVHNRESMSVLSRKLVDGYGALRVVSLIERCMNGNLCTGKN